MSSPIRLGVIGLGEMGLIHRRSAGLLDQVVVTAISDTSGPSDVEGTFFADPRDLLTSGRVDAVTIATPPGAHYELAAMALDNGLGVLCEKPLALTTEASDRLATSASISNQVAVVGHQLRYETSRRAVRDLLREGKLGEPRFASFTAVHPRMKDVSWNWWSERSAGGGMLREFGSHLVDLALWMFGPASLVNGTTRSVVDCRIDSRGLARKSDSDDIATLSILHESGVISLIHVSGLGDTELRAVHVQCTSGSVSIDGDDLVRIEAHDEPAVVSPWTDSYPPLTRDPSDHWTPPFAHMMEHWLEACRGGALDADLCTFRQAADVVRIIDEVSPPS